ncbi:MAG: M48 family metallopeptidase [Anaerolineae bacterium]|jgi:STE24 endopeptidase|nr:M48 family metallopeptidase [Anaerolineae bacterium]MBT4459296.1 M48 family metallopeptidase [Anaerolineae bacterium]MBT4841207.1 M48 family metallopeptidase [Anaerolineae bacterium]MBT6062581.1 M48 family metallopeptidase [Anaerolineae bacterium]MBT6321873.1 M48 family metallopeptidase [Anaerolineae bacterium]
MNPYLIFILTVLILKYLLNLTVSVLELRSLEPKLPQEFKDIYSQEKYQKSQEYTHVRDIFSRVYSTFWVILTLIFILVGGFNLADLMARNFNLTPILTGLIFIGSLSFLSSLISLPFSIYSTFVIEERFGFNKTTIKTFILDMIKGTLLSIIIGAPLLSAVLWFFQTTGNLAWLYVWIAVTLFTFIIQFLSPVLIMPLFNKFTPLEEGELKEIITNYAQVQNFAIEGIYTMDGSKRSTRLNAFFTGFGRFRRIVFFDTLMEKLDNNEILSVLAHEMGHFKHKHIFKMMAASILQSGVMFFILSLFLGNQQLFDAFGMAHISIYAGLIFFSFLYSPISTLLSIFFNIFSRKHEYEADAWTVKTTGEAEALISGLKKLSVHNLSSHLTV